MLHGLHAHHGPARKVPMPAWQQVFSVAFAVILTVLLLILLFVSVRVAR